MFFCFLFSLSSLLPTPFFSSLLPSSSLPSPSPHRAEAWLVLMISHAADASERELGGYRPGPGFHNTSTSSYGKGDSGHSMISFSTLVLSGLVLSCLVYNVSFSSFLPIFILAQHHQSSNLISKQSRNNINRGVPIILPRPVYSPLICLP